jgi:type I restriction-modification system DNA methylase subunit
MGARCRLAVHFYRVRVRIYGSGVSGKRRTAQGLPAQCLLKDIMLSRYGQEKILGTWAIAQISLFLHDIDDAFIAKGDNILNPKRNDPEFEFR